MASADEYRASAEQCEEFARSAPTPEEKRDLLDTARALRKAAAELDARLAIVRRPGEHR
jgi:ubiquinone biosynthesis protein UbiJ